MKTVYLIIISSLIFYNVDLHSQTKIKEEDGPSSAFKTIANLKKNINSELLSYKYYSACSQKAMKEGYQRISEEFNAIALQENLHYIKYKELLEEMKFTFIETEPAFTILSTKENLAASVLSEELSIRDYEKDITLAESEGFKEIAESYKWAQKMEAVHKEMFEKLIDNFAAYKKRKIQ